MSEQERAQIVGRSVVEYLEVRKHRSLLIEEAERIQAKLRSVEQRKGEICVFLREFGVELAE